MVRSMLQLRPCAFGLLGLVALGGCTPGTGQPTGGRLGLGLADSALAGGAPGLALQVSKAVLARNPHDVPALLRRGDAYYQLGDYGRAAASYREVTLLQPRSVAGLMGLGRVALATDPAEAGARFSEALALEPANQAALSDRAIAEDLDGLHAEAQADYRRAIALGDAQAARGEEDEDANGSLAATRVDLAVSLAISGHAPEAVLILRPIAAAPDATPRVRQDLALALTLDGHRDEAARLLVTEMNQDQARRTMAGFEALRVDDQASSPGIGTGNGGIIHDGS